MDAALPGRSPATEARSGRILLLAALSREVRPFLRQIKARPVRDLGLPAWEFTLREGRGLVAVAGMGEAASLRAAVRLLARWRPGALVSLGFGGALTPEVPPGGLVLGESAWRYRPETRSLSPLFLPPPPRALPELLRGLTEAGLPASAGAVVTTPRILHKRREGGPLHLLPHPVVDLETGALAELAGREGLAFLSLRAITDGAAEEIPDFLTGVGEGLSVGPGAAIRWVALHPPRVRMLLHLWRRSRQAAETLARALLILLPLLLSSGDQLQDQPAEKR